MNIQDATKQAIEKGQYISRNTKSFEVYRIQPTQTNECFVVHISKEHLKNLDGQYAPGKRWNPKVEDILANDWMVMTL